MTLEIKELSKQTGNDWSFRQISFSVSRGELLGILGPEDSGKTELLRAISGIDKPSAGEIVLDGVQILDGRKNGFYYPLKQQRSEWRGLFAGSNPISAAKTQRQLLADSFTRLESVFLIDSPTQGLDFPDIGKFGGEIVSTTTNRNLCTVVATNNSNEIFQLCDRVAVMSRGEIVQIGTPEEVYSNPDTLEAATSFGPNNIIEARRITSNKKDIPEFCTLGGEHRISTGAAEKKKFGPINQTIFLSIRPEFISLSFGASFPEDNLLKARVTGVEFRGATTVIYLNASGLILRALALRVVGLSEGDECMVGLPPDRIRILAK